jgi:hypothetical protein
MDEPKMSARVRDAARVLYSRVIFPTTAITSLVFVNYYVQTHITEAIYR